MGTTTVEIESESEIPQFVPASQIVPFQLQSMFVAPFAFLYSDPAEAYPLFREMYCQYFCRLQVFSTKNECIVYLCKTFEELVQAQQPNACYHCLSLDVTPLQIAFGWIFSAFVDYL